MSDVVDAFEDIGDAVVDFVEDVGEGIAEAARWTAQAAKDVTDFLDDAVSKDGWLTNFVQDYIPGGGLVTAVAHAAAGNFDYAEYAAVKGASTLVTAVAATAGGVLLGPAGAVLLGAAVGAATTLFESGMKTYLAASVKHKIADLSLEGVLIGAAVGGAAAGLGSAIKAAGTGLKKLGGALKRASDKVRNGARKLRGKPPIAPPIPPAVPKPPGLIKRVFEKGKSAADAIKRTKRRIQDAALRPIKQTTRAIRNRIRGWRGKPPVPPRRIGPLTKKETLIREAKRAPIKQTNANRKRIDQTERIRDAAGLPTAGAPEPTPAGCLPALIPILIAILTGILIAILIVTLRAPNTTTVASGGSLNPSDKGAAAPPVITPSEDTPANPDGDATAAPAPAQPAQPAAPAAPQDPASPDPETQAPQPETPDQEPETPAPTLTELSLLYRKPACAGREDAVEALITSSAGNSAPFTIVFQSSTAGTRQISGFTATQGEVFFVMPVSGPGEVLAIQSLELAGQQYATDWGSYTTVATDFPCDPTAITVERFVCWYPETEIYYLGIAFYAAAPVGHTATLILTADGIGDSDPETDIVHDNGEFYYFVPYVEPGWTVSVGSLNVGSTSYSTDFGTYLIPETEELC